MFIFSYCFSPCKKGTYFASNGLICFNRFGTSFVPPSFTAQCHNLKTDGGEVVSSNIISNAAIQGIDHLFQLVDQMLFSPSHPKGLILKLNKQNSSFESSNKSFLPFCVNLTFTMKGSRPSERLACKRGFKARHEIGTVCTLSPLKEAVHLLPLHL